MVVKSKHSATKLDIACLSSQFLTQHMLDLYDEFNKEVFEHKIQALAGVVEMCNIVYEKFGFQHPTIDCIDLEHRYIKANEHPKDVALGFSAGLDSTYQAIALKEAGFNVHLIFVRNVNTYENGQSWKYAIEIAHTLGLDMIDVVMQKNLKKSSNEFRQHWPENPIKNQLILAVMLDICLDRGWKFISLGDDFDLTIDKAVAGVNVTDAREVTMSFLNGISAEISGFEFIPIAAKHDKSVRLQAMLDYGLQDMYYSCVQPGRLNKHFRNWTQDKFNIHLFGNNCGKCRKCCMHNLILHYTRKMQFSDEYIKYCWEKMYMTGCKADYEFFKPEIPLEQRIANLFSY